MNDAVSVGSEVIFEGWPLVCFSCFDGKMNCIHVNFYYRSCKFVTFSFSI